MYTQRRGSPTEVRKKKKRKKGSDEWFRGWNEGLLVHSPKGLEGYRLQGDGLEGTVLADGVGTNAEMYVRVSKVNKIGITGFGSRFAFI